MALSHLMGTRGVPFLSALAHSQNTGAVPSSSTATVNAARRFADLCMGGHW